MIKKSQPHQRQIFICINNRQGASQIIETYLKLEAADRKPSEAFPNP